WPGRTGGCPIAFAVRTPCGQDGPAHPLRSESVRVLLVSTYELGHQPLHVASPAAALLAAGHDVRTLDTSVEPWNPDLVAWADAVAFSVPMHTAMRLALRGAAAVRAARRGLPICLYGLYATVSGDVTLGPAGGAARPGRPAAAPALRPAGRRRRGAHRRLRRGQPGLRTPVPALPHPGDLRRAAPHRPRGRRPRRRRGPGRGRSPAHHLRRSRLPQRPAPFPPGGGRRPQALAGADLRLHHQGRAHPPPRRRLAAAGRRRLPLRRQRLRERERLHPRRPRQGPHHRRDGRRRRPAPPSRHRDPPVVPAVHAVDDGGRRRRHRRPGAVHRSAARARGFAAGADPGTGGPARALRRRTADLVVEEPRSRRRRAADPPRGPGGRSPDRRRAYRPDLWPRPGRGARRGRPACSGVRVERRGREATAHRAVVLLNGAHRGPVRLSPELSWLNYGTGAPQIGNQRLRSASSGTSPWSAPWSWSSRWLSRFSPPPGSGANG